MTTDPLDRLFSVPLKEFIEERKRIVAALKVAGQGQRAKEVAAITKPSVSAWATNQLVRDKPELVAELAEVTGRLRDAQLGGGSKKDGDAGYGEAVTRQRELLKAFRTRTEEILSSSGHAANPQVVERTIRNLREGVADPEMRERIQRGQLTDDLEARDFAALIAESAANPPRRQEPPKRAPAPLLALAGGKAAAKEDKDRREREAAVREAVAARQRAAARAEAQRELTRLQAALAANERVLEKEERALEIARDELSRREEKAAATRSEADRLSRALAAAEAALEKLSAD